MSRQIAVLLLVVFLVFNVALLTSAADQSPASDPFALDGAQNIMEEAHFGIVNGMLSTGIPYRDVFAIQGLWAPPYVSSNFTLGITILDQPAPADTYTWHPFHVQRKAEIQGIDVETVTMLLPGTRSGVLEITLHNKNKQERTVPLTIAPTGTLDDSRWWEFAAPQSKTPTVPKVVDGALILQQDKLAIVLRGEKEIRWSESSPAGHASVVLPPDGQMKLHVVFSVGPATEATAACVSIAADPGNAMTDGLKVYTEQVRSLFEKIPRLESPNAALERFYSRSLVHFLMSRWDVPEFVLHPYLSTGSVRGGCVCDYLWNFGEMWELLPLFDPEISKTHIKKFLAVDMLSHFAFEPTTGKAFGPWYMVNQEKIIGSIYYYVRNTGDVAFLNETVDGKTILEHAILNARYGDDPATPVALIDYGDSNSHLELRRGLPYNHVMPDLNGRRYENYLMAAALAEAAGKPVPDLLQRAEELKTLLKKTLWNEKTRWFDFQNEKGEKDTRYTVQMFKMFGSKVLDAEQEAGLLAHLNSEEEFLSEFGLHSLAKQDPAYDPADVDNGGPGACVCFPPQIAERLYKAGRPKDAENILKRILWWGERMPYWGDSLVADKIDYRRDTPLQCTSDGVTVAQCVIFGMLGVRAEFDGSICIDPHPPAFAPKMELKGLRLRGQRLDIAVDGAKYEVHAGANKLDSVIGRPILVRNGRLVLAPAKQ